MVVITVIVESCFIAFAITNLTRFGSVLTHFSLLTRTTITLTALVMWLLTAILVAFALWAGLLLALGEFETFSAAMYFSSITATTVGYGDSLLSDQWKLLSGVIAANGLVLFSLNTAFLFEAVRQINAAD